MRTPSLRAASLLLAAFFLVAEASDDNPITRGFFCRANGCCDQHEWCRFWASMGECRTNSHWMANNCQLACNSCNRPPVAQSQRSPAPRPPNRRPPPPPPVTATSRAFNPFVNRPPPTTRRIVTTSTTRFTTTPTRFTPPPVTPAPPRPAPSSNPLARCRQIQADPSLAAEVLIRENLVFPKEDLSGRRQILGLDKVVRSNIANACVPRLDDAECERSLCYNLYFPSIRNIRPSPREANRAILSSPKTVTLPDFNMLLFQFGQFIAHDMSKTTLVPSAKCNVCQNIPGRCMAVFVQSQDPNQSFKRDTCIRVSRSSAICGSGRSKPRQQLNENTGYIDASPIYGSSTEDLHKFREGNTGFLKLQNFNGMRLLPFDTSTCRSAADCKAIFIAGDSRVNLFLGLTSFHLSREIMSATARANLERVYRTPDRVDFYPGAVLEDPVVRGLIGPTLACVVGPQFARTRDGDRWAIERMDE
ncbi:Peroxidase mlt-7 [Aphelenchoides fujianensis]|nr:Peroxidase mlt-7 [Aphelenchoides fujianensis]